MSLLFGAGSGDLVDISGTALDNQHVLTILMWSYPTSQTDFRRLFSKGSANEKVAIWWNAGSGDIRFFIDRATTDAIAVSNTGHATDNVWNYHAFTYDGTDGPRIFWGTMTAAAAEVTYSSRTVGSGAEASDSGTVMRIGNLTEASPNTSFDGRISFWAHYRRRLTLAEIVTYQFRPVPDADCDAFFMLGWNGTGTQPNWGPLGAANNGTVTGATVAGCPPLPSLWARSLTFAPAIGRSLTPFRHPLRFYRRSA